MQMIKGKGLKALNRIGIIHIRKGNNRMFDEYLFREYKEEYSIIEKELKALEIIKNKFVNVNTLVNSIIGAIEPLEFYNEKVSENLKLTQEEFILLKEVLYNDK